MIGKVIALLINTDIKPISLSNLPNWQWVDANILRYKKTVCEYTVDRNSPNIDLSKGGGPEGGEA